METFRREIRFIYMWVINHSGTPMSGDLSGGKG